VIATDELESVGDGLDKVFFTNGVHGGLLPVVVIRFQAEMENFTTIDARLRAGISGDGGLCYHPPDER
jgi:hypothetical protein